MPGRCRPVVAAVEEIRVVFVGQSPPPAKIRPAVGIEAGG
jgi:hypothetical protein